MATFIKRAVQGLLWLIIVSCATCFTIITFMRTTDWYAQNQDFVQMRNNMTINFPGDVPVPFTTSVKNGKTVITLIGRDQPLWAGSTAFPVSLQWGSIMIAALAVAGLKYLDTCSSSPSVSPGAASASTSLALMHTLNGARIRTWRKIRFVCNIQVGPTRFWNWWCGGLSIMDLFLVMLYLGLTACYMYYLTARKFKNTDAVMTPPPAPAPVFMPPFPSPAPQVVNLNETSGNSTKGGGSNSTKAEPSPARVVDLRTPLYMQRRMEDCGKASGEVLRLSMMLMFIPISRSNFLKYIFGTDFDGLVKYHRWMSWGTIIIVFTHSVLYMVKWGAESSYSHELGWDNQSGRVNISGLIATIAALFIAFTSTKWFRAAYFWLFYRVHILSMMVFLIFALMHYTGLVSWILPGLVLYALDRSFRFWQLGTNWTSIGPDDFAVHDNMISIRLVWAKNEAKAFAAGQTLYLLCPSISATGSHPFTVADVLQAEDGTTQAIVHFPAKGPWSKALLGKLRSGQRVRMQVEGPYDAILDKDPATPVVIMVAGGIGVTPLLALLRRYLRQQLSNMSRDATEVKNVKGVPKVYMVWSSRCLSDLKLFGQDLLTACTSPLTYYNNNSYSPRHSDCKAPEAVHAALTVETTTDTQAGTFKALSQAGSSSSGELNMQLGRNPDSWLQATLHYTGFELEQRAASVKLDIPSKESATSTDKPSQADNIAPRLLSAHPASTPVLYAVCVVFSFLGAWAGLLLAAWYSGYWRRTTAEGAEDLTVGILQWVCISSGGIVGSMIALCASWAITRVVRSRQSVSAPVAMATDASVYKLDAKSNSQVLGSFLRTTLTVLPGYILAPIASSAADACGLALGRGRPNLEAMMKEVMQLHSDLPEIEVLVAGSDSLSESITALCGKYGGGKGPVFTIKRVAHHH